MLDKSIPYYNIIMCRKSGTYLPVADLPEGYSFKYFENGDETYWADIETSVGEFDNFEESADYFKTQYLPYLEELQRRTIFVENDNGDKVATFTIWWEITDNVRVPAVHWVAVKPEFQGLGLGKALVMKGMEIALNLEGDKDIYLHTQTWSYKAIGVYMHAGFEILETGTFGNKDNDYKIAMETIKNVFIERERRLPYAKSKNI